jgi:hypothetical protein
MAKTKSKAILIVADGAGGMMEVKDRRFENGDWPINFEIPVEQEQADRWPRYLSAGCHRRGWVYRRLGNLSAQRIAEQSPSPRMAILNSTSYGNESAIAQ